MCAQDCPQHGPTTEGNRTPRRSRTRPRKRDHTTTDTPATAPLPSHFYMSSSGRAAVQTPAHPLLLHYHSLRQRLSSRLLTLAPLVLLSSATSAMHLRHALIRSNAHQHMRDVERSMAPSACMAWIHASPLHASPLSTHTEDVRPSKPRVTRGNTGDAREIVSHMRNVATGDVSNHRLRLRLPSRLPN